ncbi:MAG: hypothetical protein V7K33_00995 [Nostoc sp.]
MIAIFGSPNSIIHRNRCVVDWVDNQVKSTNNAATITVANSVDKAVSAFVVGIGSVDEVVVASIIRM